MKNAGIPRMGFEYQDLIGIEVLLRFYRDPNLFHWVELEADEPKVGKLDDVVAARKDNTFELLQVKFTVDPNRYFLDWDWLLEKKGKGTSLLQKWSGALVKVKGLGAVHSAKLRTNRRPSDDFVLSLKDGFVDFDKIRTAQQATLLMEFGSEAAARDFFEQFEFAHSEALVDDLEARLKGDIVPTDTDNTGWLVLREQARRWATRKKSPDPDGRIRYEHLVQIITKRRPKPIPQNFAVPALYQVPSKDFHGAFTARVKTELKPVSVLWGSPGRGKSTYLSFLVQSLRDADLPVVRHHYFLSLDDSTVDRVSFTEISSSLMDQIAGRYLDAVRGMESAPNQLRKWLEACGKHYSAEGKRFYVVVDGLDHVWREQRNTAQMEHLFNYLLPCPDNVYLLIGTQKVAPDQLPLKLIQRAEKKDWIEVPPMDEAAVHAWLTGQHDAGRLLLRDIKHNVKLTELSEVSKAFFAISNGNPLHLIYSFEALVRRGVVVTSDEVSLLPSCPDGDIRKYYGGLWTRLPANARKVLHLVAGSDFHWPPDGLRRCAGPLDEVDHLLEHRRSGLVPFHGSILAYAREQPDHDSTFQSVLPSVVRWLEREAPEYWRWAWLWIMRARSGDTNELLSLTSRDWIIRSLAKGWPADQIVIILSAAEERAFERNDYVRTMQLRTLKTRLQNGQDYQIDRFHDFQESAVRSAGNEQQILNMADGLPSASDDEIVTLLRCLNGVEKDGIGAECYEELRRQVNLWISLRHRAGEEFFSLAENFIEAIVDFGRPDLRKLLRFIGQFHPRDRMYLTFLRHVVRTRNFDMACSMLGLLVAQKHKVWRNATENAVVQIASAEDIDLALRLAPQSNISPLLSCWYRLKGHQPPQPCNLIDLSAAAVGTDYDYGPNPAVEKFLHAFFFSAFDAALQAQGDCVPALPGIERSKLGWLQEAIDRLWNAAWEIAKNPTDIGFGSIFVGLAELAPVDIQHRPSEPASAQYRALRAIVGEIALDLHGLKCAMTGASLVEPDAFGVARGSIHWVDAIWIAGRTDASNLLRKRRVFLGIVAARQKPPEKTTKKSNRATKDNVSRGGTPPDVRKFGPDKLEALLKRVASPKLGYIHRNESLVRWLKYWASKNKGLAALRSIDDYFNSHDNPHDIEPLLDEAFDVSIKYEGKKKAYKWLVRAHIERRGWQSNWDDGSKVQRRLELAAKHYKDKWVDFIRDTSRPARYWEKRRSGFTIGMQRLVSYLLLVKQTKCAVRFAGSMVQLTTEEVHDQPIPSAAWLS
ncbi:NACHT domain-containing protein [Bradyrhizobium sp. URHD0069]|uniref:NACHT domain-containing protein n=1 Tax=Bradyrhizobium sp. URHD0069 TaxID=1380355 RepID=UPI000ACCB058|nr:NACHT domain-containing protein [Bradyrhizobium sp. URHD0069]